MTEYSKLKRDTILRLIDHLENPDRKTLITHQVWANELRVQLVQSDLEAENAKLERKGQGTETSFAEAIYIRP